MKPIRSILTIMLVFTLLFGAMVFPVSASENLVYGIGYVNATTLRLRSQASTASSVTATAKRNECVVILNKIGQWYKVMFNLQEGYMHEDYLSVATKENAELGYGVIRGTGVNMRSGPSTSYPVVFTGTQGSKCYIIGINEGWYKVIYNNQICYIRSDYISLSEYPYENQASSNRPIFFRGGKSLGIQPSASALSTHGSASSIAPSVQNVAATGSQILAEAKQYLGAPYRSGGASPSGFDCSGFVYYVLKQVGYSPARTPSAQYNQGTSVSKASLQAGDIVFFANTAASGISHVGIYAGNGKFIHAPNSRSTISYSDLTSGYWANHYYGARRMA